MKNDCFITNANTMLAFRTQYSYREWVISFSLIFCQHSKVQTNYQSKISCKNFIATTRCPLHKNNPQDNADNHTFSAIYH